MNDVAQDRRALSISQPSLEAIGDVNEVLSIILRDEEDDTVTLALLSDVPSRAHTVRKIKCVVALKARYYKHCDLCAVGLFQTVKSTCKSVDLVARERARQVRYVLLRGIKLRNIQPEQGKRGEQQ